MYGMDGKNTRMGERVTKLAAENAKLREALGAVEWVENAEEFTDESKWCPRCKMFERHGHDEDCQLDAALAQPSPPKNPGDYKRARGVVPWKEGDPPPERRIAKGRGRKVGDADGDAG